MPYKTIQQNFANGELNPKMQGRADVDMYYKSAQKMRDVVTTPYGGFVRRPGSKVIYQGGNGLTSLPNMTTDTDITDDETNSIDKIADLDITTYAELSSDEAVSPGTKLASVADSLSPISQTTNYYAWIGYNTKYYAWNVGSITVYTLSDEPKQLDSVFLLNDGTFTQANGYVREFDSGNNRIQVEVIEIGYGSPTWLGRYATSDEEREPFYVYTLSSTPSISDSIYSDTDDTMYGKITGIDADTITDGTRTFTRDSDFDETKTISIPGTPKTVKRITVRRISSTNPQELQLIGTTSEGDIVLKEFTSSSEEQSFFVNTNSVFTEIYITNKNEEAIDLKLYEIEVYFDNDGTGEAAVRLIPFVFNNDQSYLLSVTSGNIKIFRNDTLVASVAASVFTNDVIRRMRFTQSADTMIFVHPDMHPKQLVRGGNDSTWTFGDFAIESMPLFDYVKTAATSGPTTLKPSDIDGVITLTLGAAVEANLVGQYIEGNGGRVRITSQNGTKLTGYTVIGFYSDEQIGVGSWTYTTNYENVWSAERGWPCSITFHGGRLWFGGSKSRPQTVWGSKVGLFNRFDATSGYNNDAIEFTLGTNELNKITDIYSQRNLIIFTLSGEFVCFSSFNEPITPDNVSASKQTANGSWEKTTPVDIEGIVMFVERKGQGLMAFAPNNTVDIYSANNSSLINSHLIKAPVDIAVERNNLIQQTNYVYLVNSDGTMCVVNLLAGQGITGGYTLWETNGSYKAVCVLPDQTYVLVSRQELSGDRMYIERLDNDALSDGEETAQVNGENSVNIPRFAGKEVDGFLNNVYVGTFEVDGSGTVQTPETLSGMVTFGYPFRWIVESNFLEIPQLGIGISRKKRMATMTVRTLDTKELTVNGETQPGGEGIYDIEYYGVGDWSEHPTWIMQEQKPCKVNVMAVQMNVNYQVAGDEY